MILPAAALTIAACGGGDDGFSAEVDQYWGSLTVDEQSTVCVALGQMSGFELITANSNEDGTIDLLDGGTVEDTLGNRTAVGEALDDLVADRCP